MGAKYQVYQVIVFIKFKAQSSKLKVQSSKFKAQSSKLNVQSKKIFSI